MPCWRERPSGETICRYECTMNDVAEHMMYGVYE
jgi:hypothetical protein